MVATPDPRSGPNQASEAQQHELLDEQDICHSVTASTVRPAGGNPTRERPQHEKPAEEEEEEVKEAAEEEEAVAVAEEEVEEEEEDEEDEDEKEDGEEWGEEAEDAEEEEEAEEEGVNTVEDEPNVCPTTPAAGPRPWHPGIHGFIARHRRDRTLRTHN